MDHETLIQSVASAKSSGQRPIMTMANGDNTWLISIPRPDRTTGKAFYHILQDPWLGGDAVAFYAWIFRMRHSHKEALGSAEAVEKWIEEVESAAGGSKGDGDDETWLDAILITHTNGDHMHEETLRGFRPDAKVFAVADAAATMNAWKHFDDIVVVPDFKRDKDETWPATPGMPDWLHVFRLPDDGGVMPYLYNGTVIGFKGADGKEEMIMYSPHGIDAEVVAAARDAKPGVDVLAMVHPLHRSGFPENGGITLGVVNGLKVERRTGAKYWLGTHDDKIEYAGLISWVIKSRRLTLDYGLEEEAKETGKELPRPNLIELANGGSCVLA
ncbi:hypothetical protein CPLU01_13482 [Colletotrichum plurivorum]|uniref:Uncharacterized protein n=1 Tax=Colletotrichum plurivorum TaxID=2175906 RepID=A0A8H6N379_9PEZI|nr:hypothetical protein CPLU01_13482 [Colletotrichum plurivorum]